MLPYRLRPPAFASNEYRAQKLQQESNDEILAGGGPIQREMEKDLMELGQKFMGQLESLSAFRQQHLSAGEAFQCFKRVFGQAKVALVHTRTVPPRSDRGAYTQLIYSACLSLLKRSFQESGDKSFEHAAFSIFCLHALYETCPLPIEPSEPLHLLPMGLQHPDNPKFLYRRTFKLPIRIDRHHYSLLQRLRDEALSRHADCQCQRIKAFESRLGSKTPEENDALEYSCSCGVVMDVVEIVSRLQPNLDLVEYTGPVGLEALAGHADYPYHATRPKKSHTAATNMVDSVITTKLMDEELDAIVDGKDDSATGSVEVSLGKNIEEYQTNLREVRMTHFSPTLTTNQALRIQNALRPIFDQPSSESAVNEASTSADAGITGKEQSQHVDDAGTEAVTQVTMEPAQQIDNGENATSTASPSDAPRKSALDKLNSEIVFPAEVTEAQRDAIRAALDLALDNGDIQIKAAAKGDDSLFVASVSENQMDDNDDSASVGNDVASGLGAAALRDLLAQVSASVPSWNVPSAATTSTPRDDEATESITAFGSNFLASNLDSTISPNPGHSDEASVSSEDSVVGTDVGGMSLHALWSAVDEEGVDHARRKRKKRKRASSSGGRGSRRKKKSPKSGRLQSRQQSEVALDLASESEDSMVSNDIGRTSLQILLDSARSEQREDLASRQQETNERKRRRTSSAGKGVQGQESHSEDPPSMSSEDSIRDDGASMGRATLQGEGRRESVSDASKSSIARYDESESTDDDGDSFLSDTEPSGRAALSALLSLATKP